jgi:glycosyltransferase involved in cell wall biosynthesis
MSARSIAHVMDYGGVTGGSFIPSLCTLARAIARRGDRFDVLATPVPNASWPDELRASGVRLRFVESDADVTDALRAMKPDVVHSHFTRYDVAAAQSEATTYWHVHSYRERRSPLAELKSRIKYRYFGRNVRAWICVSQGVRNEIVARGAPSKRTLVVHNGIDAARFRPPTARERDEARARLGIATSDSVLLFFDRTPGKGGATLRDALARLPGHRLLLTGGDMKDWHDFARDYAVTISPRVSDTRELYWAADAFTLPSYGEGFSYVLAEAAACGLPIAASDIAPVREILSGARDVWVAPPRDAHALADALETALASDKPLGGRERILAEFTVERWAHDLITLYNA